MNKNEQWSFAGISDFMKLRLKVSALFSSAAMLVCLGYPILLFPVTGTPDWPTALYSYETFLQFAALPTVVAGVVAFLSAPKLIKASSKIPMSMVLCASTILVTHFIYGLIIGVFALSDSATSANPLPATVFFTILALVLVGPAYLVTALLLPFALRWLVVRHFLMRLGSPPRV